jgi:Ni/Co efflux regulator RcnB
VNRREVLTGMALASAAVAVPATAMAKASTNPSRHAWDMALAKFRCFHDEHEAACVAHSSVEERYYTDRTVQPLGAEFRKGDTVDSYHARLEADRAEFERLDAECVQRTGYAASETRQAQACDASWEAMGDLIATPAPGLAEVIQKIELATDYGRTVNELDPVCADLRRFLSQGKA